MIKAHEDTLEIFGVQTRVEAGELVSNMKDGIRLRLALRIVVLNGLLPENMIEVSLQNGRIRVLCFIARLAKAPRLRHGKPGKGVKLIKP